MLFRSARASVEEIAETAGVGPEMARAVHERLHGAAPVTERRASA